MLFTILVSDKLNHTGTTYTGPARAASHPLLEKWLVASMPQLGQVIRTPTSKFGVNIAAQACWAGECLPAGRYTATMHHVWSMEYSQLVAIDYPVVLDVLP